MLKILRNSHFVVERCWLLYRKREWPKVIAVNALLMVFVLRITILIQGMEKPGLTRYVVLQLCAMAGMFLIVLTQKWASLKLALHDKPIRLGILLYCWALLSSVWSVMPAMSFAFAFQIFAFLWIMYGLMGYHDDFYAAEKYLIKLLVVLLLFGIFRGSIIRGGIPTLAYFRSYHELNAGGIGAALFSYCIAERTVCQPKFNPSRARMLTLVAIFAFVSLLVSTSSGANVSVLVAVCMLAIVRRNKLLVMLLVSSILVVILFPETIDKILAIVFPSKTESRVLSIGSRMYLWQDMWMFIRQKPICGWGFGTIERLGPVYASDSHNAFLGILGGLGLIGTSLFITFILYTLSRMYRLRHLNGYTGLFCATLCMVSNSNTYGFLSGKVFMLTIAFFALISCGHWYQYRLVSVSKQGWNRKPCISDSAKTSEPSIPVYHKYVHIYTQI